MVEICDTKDDCEDHAEGERFCGYEGNPNDESERLVGGGCCLLGCCGGMWPGLGVGILISKLLSGLWAVSPNT